MNLGSYNCSVDKDSGAVIMRKTPELQEILKLKNEIKDLNKKMDEILALLKGGK